MPQTSNRKVISENTAFSDNLAEDSPFPVYIIIRDTPGNTFCPALTGSPDIPDIQKNYKYYVNNRKVMLHTETSKS